MTLRSSNTGSKDAASGSNNSAAADVDQTDSTETVKAPLTGTPIKVNTAKR